MRWNHLALLGALGLAPAVGAVEVSIDGARVIDAAALERALGLRHRDAPSEADIRLGLDRVARLYADRGHWQASLELRETADGWTLVVDEGEPILLDARPVSGMPPGLPRAIGAAPSGRPVTEASLDRDITLGLGRLAEAGYPYAAIDVTSFVVDGGVRYRLDIDAGPKTVVDTLVVAGTSLTRPDTMARLAGFRAGRLFRESDRVRVRDRLLRSRLFSRVDDVRLVTTSDGRTGYSVDVDEAPTTTIVGVLGVGGPAQRVNGLVDIELTNLFGTARRAAARWEGRGDERATYGLSLTEPWLFGWPISATGSFAQEQFDSTFTRTEWVGDLAIDLGERFEVRVGAQSEETVTPFSVVQRTTRESSRFGLAWDGRQFLTQPAGLQFDVLATRGTQRDRDDDGSERRTVTTITTDMSAFAPVARTTGLFFRFRGYARDAANEAVRAEVLFPVGGTDSIRGFAEQRFRTGLGATLTSEVRRYLAADGSRVAAFLDAAYLDPARTIGGDGRAWHGGAGLGVRVSSRVGLIGIDLAASNEIESTGDVRLHLTVETRY